MHVEIVGGGCSSRLVLLGGCFNKKETAAEFAFSAA